MTFPKLNRETTCILIYVYQYRKITFYILNYISIPVGKFVLYLNIWCLLVYYPNQWHFHAALACSIWHSSCFKSPASWRICQCWQCIVHAQIRWSGWTRECDAMCRLVIIHQDNKRPGGQIHQHQCLSTWPGNKEPWREICGLTSIWYHQWQDRFHYCELYSLFYFVILFCTTRF